MKPKVSAIIQARTSSTRLPNKVLLPIGDTTVIELLIDRLSRAKSIDNIILATTLDEDDNVLSDLVDSLGIITFRGSTDDVLDRYAQASQLTDSEIIVRITGDCPFIDPSLVDDVVQAYIEGDYKYYSNNNPPTYPDGLDVEVFSRESLLLANAKSSSSFEREHVTPWIRKTYADNIGVNKYHEDLSQIRWTIDEPEDYQFIVQAYKLLQSKEFGWIDLLNLCEANPELSAINSHFIRDEGSKICTGQKLYRRAKKVIPGGNSLLSKRPELFLPGSWPAYFEKAQGVHVWDLDHTKYIDMSTMSVGCCSLGYCNEEVDSSVVDAVRKGVMSSLNCPEEVLLAEKLVDIHPWSDMVRFARTGGEANAIAIRIARAASGRDKVAICGYHGWHDWYLSTNLADPNGLNSHLLPGLSPNGVPKGLAGSVIPFKYNEIDEVKDIFSNHALAALKMEVQRSVPPDPNFLAEVRRLCDEHNTVLIFDECTSGFREEFGGLHKKYSVTPDMLILGKALGNGYAITSVLGISSVMSAAQDTFISSTFWTERLGYAAALKTLEIMETVSSWSILVKQGQLVKSVWASLSSKYDFDVTIGGLDPIPFISFNHSNSLAIKTFITQEMLKHGFLASTGLFISTAHTNEVIDQYSEALDSVFSALHAHGLDTITQLLDNSVCHAKFQRLN